LEAAIEIDFDADFDFDFERYTQKSVC